MKDIEDAFKSKKLKEKSAEQRQEEIRKMAEKAEQDKAQTKLKVFL